MGLAISFIGWLGLILLGMPVAFTLGTLAIWLLSGQGSALLLLPQRMVEGVDSFPLLAIPFFIFAGNLMNTAGITHRIFDFARAIVGHIRGGLGHVNVIASVIFSGMSGSAVADAGGLGAMEIKAMRDAGYEDGFSGAVTAASSIIGPLVPPSIPMIIYGVLANASIGKLFLGGIVPGLLAAASLMIMIYFMARRKTFPVDQRASRVVVKQAFRKALLPMLTPFIIIFGIVAGVFTPTEAAAVASMYALILGVLVYREISLNDIPDIVISTIKTSAGIGFIVAMANIFAWVLTREQIPQGAAKMLTSITTDPLLLLIIINIFIFMLGMFMEGLAIMILVVPVLIPTLALVGIDPVHFGVILVFNLMIGLLTPPMGVGLYVIAGVSGIKFEVLARAMLPFLVPLVLVLMLITVVPDFVMFLPNLVFGSEY